VRLQHEPFVLEAREDAADRCRRDAEPGCGDEHGRSDWLTRRDVLADERRQQTLRAVLGFSIHALALAGLDCQHYTRARTASSRAAVLASAAISCGSMRVGVKPSTSTSPSTMVVRTSVARAA